MKKINFLCIALIAMIIISCASSKKADNNLPSWVKELSATFEKENSHSQILEYTYNNKTVYFVSFCYQCPDAIDAVYDKENNKLCEFGGFVGLNTCPDFDQKATNKKVVWRNKNFEY